MPTSIVLRNNWYAEYLLRVLDESLASGQLVHASGEGRASFVLRDGCARAAVAALVRDDVPGGCFDVAGPEALGFAEAAERLVRSTGRSVRLVGLAPTAYADHLVERGLPRYYAAHLGGLVTGPRIRPYRDMRSYIESSVGRLEAVTGRRPSERFMTTMLTSAALASSLPPSSVLHEVLKAQPDRALDVAHAIQAAHFEEGRDLNERAVYEKIFRQLGLTLEVPTLDAHRADPAVLALFQKTREQGVSTFPTVHLESAGTRHSLESEYAPDRFVGLVQRAMKNAS